METGEQEYPVPDTKTTHTCPAHVAKHYNNTTQYVLIHAYHIFTQYLRLLS